MIIIGSSLLIVVIYSIFLERKTMQCSYVKENVQTNNQKDDNLTKSNSKEFYLKEKIEEHYGEMDKLNKEMDFIIREISLKKNKIKETLNDMEKNIPRTKEYYKNNSIVNLSNKSSNKIYEESITNNIVSKDSTMSNVKEQTPLKYTKCIKLYRQGDSADAIAKKMDMGVREIELIFKLYGKEEVNVIR